jgi:hypothetical protein
MVSLREMYGDRTRLGFVAAIELDVGETVADMAHNQIWNVLEQHGPAGMVAQSTTGARLLFVASALFRRREPFLPKQGHDSDLGCTGCG